MKRRSVVKSSSSDESSGNRSERDPATRTSARHQQPPVPSYRVLKDNASDLELEIPTGVPLKELGLSSRRWNTSASRRRDESRPCLDLYDFFADGDLSVGGKLSG